MMTMITSTIVLALIIGIFGLGVITTGQQVDASIGSDEFCDDNPSHFACDDKVGIQDEDEYEEEKEEGLNNGGVNPYCDLLPDGFRDVTCHDRKDYSDETGLYTCNDGTHNVRWQDCEDVSGYDYGNEEEDWKDSCYGAGYEDGQNRPFSVDTYDHCGDEYNGDDSYYDGFFGGCMSVEGNTRDVCQSSTDA